MIDLHCHILPGVDDGPDQLGEAISMARVALGDGIRIIAATPHGADWSYGGDEAETRERISNLQSELSSQGLELEIVTGLEVYLTPESGAHYDEGRIYSLNASRYMLVEFSFHMIPDYTEQALFDLQLRGLVPVIAHPERNAAIAADPEILRRMVERGMLAQLTAGSLMGDFGPRVRDTAELLLNRGLVHLLASDGHAAHRRPPALAAGVRRAAEIVGVEAAEAMATSVPEAILRNDDVSPPEPQRAQPRSWFHFGRKK